MRSEGRWPALVHVYPEQCLAASIVAEVCVAIVAEVCVAIVADGIP